MLMIMRVKKMSANSYTPEKRREYYFNYRRKPENKMRVRSYSVKYYWKNKLIETMRNTGKSFESFGISEHINNLTVQEMKDLIEQIKQSHPLQK